jgi:hypothetical protein
MDFNFKWFFVIIGIMTVAEYGRQAYKEHLDTQIELAKVQAGKCECK